MADCKVAGSRKEDGMAECQAKSLENTAETLTISEL